MNLKKDAQNVDFSPLLSVDNNICPSNVDGFLEIEAENGASFFLFIEAKQEREAFHGLGAPRALLAQAKQPNTIVLKVVLSGERASSGADLFMPIAYQRGYRIEGAGCWSKKVETSPSDFYRRFMEWKTYARAGKAVLAAACFPVV
jgi:hypothetical protein